MVPLGFHVRTRLRSGAPIVQHAMERRIVARLAHRLGSAHVLSCFSLPDSHLHLGAHGTAAEASELCRRLEIALTRRLGLRVGFVMYPHRPLTDQPHLERALPYVLTQHDHHGVQTDPFYESSSLPDLLGMRVIPHARPAGLALRRLMPRLTRQDLLTRIHWPELAPADGPLDSLVEAACRATALPALQGSSRDVVAARGAVAQVAGARLSTADLADRLRVSRRTVQVLRARPVDPALVLAIRLQLGAEAAQAAKAACAAATQAATARDRKK